MHAPGRQETVVCPSGRVGSDLKSSEPENSCDVRGKTMAANGQRLSRVQTKRRNRSKNILTKIKYGQITGLGMTRGTQVRLY